MNALSNIFVGIAATALIIALLDMLGAWRDPKPWDDDGE